MFGFYSLPFRLTLPPGKVPLADAGMSSHPSGEQRMEKLTAALVFITFSGQHTASSSLSPSHAQMVENPESPKTDTSRAKKGQPWRRRRMWAGGAGGHRLRGLTGRMAGSSGPPTQNCMICPTHIKTVVIKMSSAWIRSALEISHCPWRWSLQWLWTFGPWCCRRLLVPLVSHVVVSSGGLDHKAQARP